MSRRFVRFFSLPVALLGLGVVSLSATTLLAPARSAHAQGSPTTLLYWNQLPSVSGVVPAAKGAVSPLGNSTFTVSVEPDSVNLPVSTTLRVWWNRYTYSPATGRMDQAPLLGGHRYPGPEPGQVSGPVCWHAGNVPVRY